MAPPGLHAPVRQDYGCLREGPQPPKGAPPAWGRSAALRGYPIPGAGHRRQRGRGWFPLSPPPVIPCWHPCSRGGLGAGLGLCSVSYFVCYSLRIKVCGSGSPRIHRHAGQKGPPSHPPQQAAAPTGVALFINIHQHAAVTELVLSKKQLYRMGGGGQARGEAGRGKWGRGKPCAGGAPGEEGVPATLQCFGVGAPPAAASPR